MKITVNTVKFFLVVVWVWMVYIVVDTSLQSNLFTEWSFLASIPWMRATLWDFYGNVIVIFIWVCYKERKVWVCGIWALLFFLLGSIATLGYLIFHLHKHGTTNSWEKVFLHEK